MAKTEGVPIVILGMHRSGTSAIASILHKIGISMGAEFLNSDGFNPGGYFEDTKFLWLNKGMIENADGTWFNPPSVKEIIKGGKKFKNSVKKTIKERRLKAKADSWGWKDPRNCLTCWNYVDVLPDARFIVVVRTLSDIKKSLNTTHGHLANWNDVIDKYYHSVTKFLDTYSNSSMNVCFEELVYEKYARNAVLEILDFVEKPERSVDRALSVVNFR